MPSFPSKTKSRANCGPRSGACLSTSASGAARISRRAIPSALPAVPEAADGDVRAFIARPVGSWAGWQRGRTSVARGRTFRGTPSSVTSLKAWEPGSNVIFSSNFATRKLTVQLFGQVGGRPAGARPGNFRRPALMPSPGDRAAPFRRGFAPRSIGVEALCAARAAVLAVPRRGGSLCGRKRACSVNDATLP